MSFHIYWGGELIASFVYKVHRDVLLDDLRIRFAYAADRIIAKDN